jgi:hypothetical protein
MVVKARIACFWVHRVLPLGINIDFSFFLSARVIVFHGECFSRRSSRGCVGCFFLALFQSPEDSYFRLCEDFFVTTTSLFTFSGTE